MKISSYPSERRRGFTLLELLVVIGIIAVLAAMLFPAVQKLRELANRTKCVNNLHQIGIAMGSHFGTHQSFPMNGTTIPSTGPYPFSLTSYPGASPSAYMWGMGDATQGPKSQPGSWAYEILPYMEETNAFKNVDFSVSVSLFMCPTRGRPAQQLLSSPDSFGWSYNAQTAGGTQLNPWGKTDYAGNYLMMPNINDPRNLNAVGGMRSYPVTSVHDGASNTILIGEKALALAAYNTGGWYWDEAIFVGGSGGTTRGVPTQSPNTNVGTPFYSQTAIVPTQTIFPPLPFYYPVGVVQDNDSNMLSASLFANNFGSPHTGGVNFLFADGSVRTFNFNFSPSVLQALLTPAGSEPAPDLGQ
jgi:prepilin-type N-terminal cleavage/methylation domain-containing protein/prepilin-type processing-associated H-X9-DG protein